MKWKKLVAALVAVIMMMSVTCVAAFAKEESTSPVDELLLLFDDGTNPMVANPPSGKSYTLDNFAKLAQYTGMGYNKGTKGPIILTKAKLMKDGKSCEVYLLTMTGLEIPTLTAQTTDPVTTVLAGMERKNDYAWNVRKILKANVPKGANVILAGHSLGGMVAQQVAANKKIQDRYNILNIVAWGSPVEFEGQIEGQLTRLADVNDIVPTLSAASANDEDVYTEDGGYSAADITFEAHRNSYVREDVWGAYDVLGMPGGSAKLILDLTTQQFFESGFAFMEYLGF